MQKFQMPCVLLCGGKSSRMGADKCFLKFGGQSLVKWQFERLCGLFENVFISCKNDKFGGEFEEKMLIFDENLGFNINFVANLSENSSLAANLSAQNANFGENLNKNLQKAANFGENLGKNSRKSEDCLPFIAF